MSLENCSCERWTESRLNRWYQRLTAVRGLSAGTAVRHFNVMHHMMEKASTIWSKETGLERNPADAWKSAGRMTHANGTCRRRSFAG